MVVEFFGDHFNGELNRDEVQKVASLSVEKVKGVAWKFGSFFFPFINFFFLYFFHSWFNLCHQVTDYMK